MWRFDGLSFESDVFGVPVGRVFPDVDGVDIKTLSRGWLAEGLWLVSARIMADDKASADILKDANFVLIETLVTLERPLNGAMVMPRNIAFATPADRSACLTIAGSAFLYDRFHSDSRVPKEAADRLKTRWVANSLDGRADTVLVAQSKGGALGFMTCMAREDIAIIDLIAVSTNHQRRGIGNCLVQGALAYYSERKRAIQVGTQQSNTTSLKLYESNGFVQTTLHQTYHWINPNVMLNEVRS